jgi:predicted RNase H-like HicB family nuclease
MLQKKSLLSKSGLHAIVWQEDDLFVAKCVEVELASQGKSEKEAINNLEEAMSLFFEDEKIKVPQLSNLRLISL